MAGSTHSCKTVRLDFGFCSDLAGLVFGNYFLAVAAERTESLEPQVTTFWYRKVLQTPAKCVHGLVVQYLAAEKRIDSQSLFSKGSVSVATDSEQLAFR